MKPIDQWQDGEELRLPTGESVTVRSESDADDQWWSMRLPNGVVAMVYPDLPDRVTIELQDGHETPLSVYWTGERAELGYVPLCLCGNDMCNDSSLAFGTLHDSVWFRPDIALSVLAVLARMPRTNIPWYEADVPPGQPQKPLWLGVLDEEGNAVLQRRVYGRPRVEPDELLGPAYEIVATRPLDDLVER